MAVTGPVIPKVGAGKPEGEPPPVREVSNRANATCTHAAAIATAFDALTILHEACDIWPAKELKDARYELMEALHNLGEYVPGYF